MQVLVYILGVTRHVMPERPHGPRVDFSFRFPLASHLPLDLR